MTREKEEGKDVIVFAIKVPQEIADVLKDLKNCELFSEGLAKFDSLTQYVAVIHQLHRYTSDQQRNDAWNSMAQQEQQQSQASSIVR